MSASESGQTLYDAVGGMAFFEALVGRFYDGVADDPTLRRLYPEPDDLGPARRRLTLFLAQYWGRPTTYSEERGHPRLRMRHFPFAIGPDERDRWLVHMAAAVEQTAPTPAIAERLMRRTSCQPPRRCATATTPPPTADRIRHPAGWPSG